MMHRFRVVGPLWLNSNSSTLSELKFFNCVWTQIFQLCMNSNSATLSRIFLTLYEFKFFNFLANIFNVSDHGVICVCLHFMVGINIYINKFWWKRSNIGLVSLIVKKNFLLDNKKSISFIKRYWRILTKALKDWAGLLYRDYTRSVNSVMWMGCDFQIVGYKWMKLYRTTAFISYSWWLMMGCRTMVLIN